MRDGRGVSLYGKFLPLHGIECSSIVLTVGSVLKKTQRNVLYLDLCDNSNAAASMEPYTLPWFDKREGNVTLCIV